MPKIIAMIVALSSGGVGMALLSSTSNFVVSKEIQTISILR
ncbi:MAG TPA: hypothetical protein VE504_04010 [Nitrososphaeraceae archaeon]|nr:hypothetical protein [Nitrososphaeraceae archaeon]